MTEAKDVDLEDAFEGESSLEQFYFYNGSLTYPPCTEGVEWYVWRQVLKIG